MRKGASAERRRQRRRSRQGSRRAKITIGEAKAIGWKASSNALGRSCGKRGAPPTRGTESARRQSKWNAGQKRPGGLRVFIDRKSTRLNSSHLGISYAVFCLKKK